MVEGSLRNASHDVITSSPDDGDAIMASQVEKPAEAKVKKCERT